MLQVERQCLLKSYKGVPYKAEHDSVLCTSAHANRFCTCKQAYCQRMCNRCFCTCQLHMHYGVLMPFGHVMSKCQVSLVTAVSLFLRTTPVAKHAAMKSRQGHRSRSTCRCLREAYGSRVSSTLSPHAAFGLKSLGKAHLCHNLSSQKPSGLLFRLGC